MSRERQWPTYLQQWVGQFAIKILPAAQFFEPQVVFISRISRYGDLRGAILNTSIHLYAKPQQLIPYSPRLYERLHAQFLHRKARATLKTQAVRANTGKYP